MRSSYRLIRLGSTRETDRHRSANFRYPVGRFRRAQTAAAERLRARVAGLRAAARCSTTRVRTGAWPGSAASAGAVPCTAPVRGARRSAPQSCQAFRARKSRNGSATSRQLSRTAERARAHGSCGWQRETADRVSNAIRIVPTYCFGGLVRGKRLLQYGTIRSKHVSRSLAANVR